MLNAWPALGALWTFALSFRHQTVGMVPPLMTYSAPWIAEAPSETRKAVGFAIS